MPMYKLIDYSDNYSGTSGSLWQFKRDESHIDGNENPVNVSTDNSSFECKWNIYKKEVAIDNGVFKNIKIAVPLKHLSNFCRSLEINACD